MTRPHFALFLVLIVGGCSNAVTSTSPSAIVPSAGALSSHGRTAPDYVRTGFRNDSPTCVYFSPYYSYSTDFGWYEAGAHVVKSGETIFIDIDYGVPFAKPDLEQKATVEFFHAKDCVAAGSAPHAPVETGKMVIERIDGCHRYATEIAVDNDYAIRKRVAPGCAAL